MALLIAGIDEAGYGPLLGPLCVGLSVFRVREVPDPSKLPDLWKMLNKGVCKGPGRAGENDRRGRVAVADSKELKLANSVKCAHPLVHLERGVLTFVRCLPDAAGAMVSDDAGLFNAIGAAMPEVACYAVEPRALPMCMTAAEVSIAHNVLQRAMVTAGVELLRLRCEVIGEPRYQQIVKDTNNKAETTATAFGEHLRRVWELYGAEPEESRLGVVCDRMGGRIQYSGLIERELPGCTVEIIEESENRSRYGVTAKDAAGRERKASVSFLVEGESLHMPVALASMVAKFTRELSMMRFNQHWNAVRAARGYAEVKPTAGYRNDAHRWLEDIGDVMSEEDKKVLIRWV
ncbi:MAG TPA: hypothetical protein VD997_05675 [Phycisphaerales bacterium]|nr:hypothetical protein [Phycisphaerales bacterium]